MPWIARDKTGKNPYRIFGKCPVLLHMVSYGGDKLRDQFTWSYPNRSNNHTYGPLSNTEPTEIAAADCPINLEPSEGPIEVVLVLKSPAPPRLFEGEGI